MNRTFTLAGLALVLGGAALDDETRRVLQDFAGSPHIFNLGHGITPEASPDNLARLVDVVRGG